MLLGLELLGVVLRVAAHGIRWRGQVNRIARTNRLTQRTSARISAFVFVSSSKIPRRCSTFLTCCCKCSQRFSSIELRFSLSLNAVSMRAACLLHATGSSNDFRSCNAHTPAPQALPRSERTLQLHGARGRGRQAVSGGARNDDTARMSYRNRARSSCFNIRAQPRT